MNNHPTFAMVDLRSNTAVRLFYGALPPEPLVWPDASASHAVTSGFRHGDHQFVNVVITPPSPGEFYTVTATAEALVNDAWTITNTWTAAPLDSVQTTLSSRVDATAENIRLSYATFGSCQAMTYMQKLAEATALADDPNPTAENYPLLNATVGIEAPTLTGVASLVRAAAQKWKKITSDIEAVRLGTKAAINAAITVDAAVCALSAASWPLLNKGHGA